MARYVTNFSLTNPVNDYNAAADYLREPMTKYLINDLDYLHLEHLQGKIENIEWVLEDEQSGYIELKTTEPIAWEDLVKISDWVSGQCSDGLGEGFEQQDFAEVRYYDEDEEDYDTGMASFDWKTNKYRFIKVSDSKKVKDSYIEKNYYAGMVESFDNALKQYVSPDLKVNDSGKGIVSVNISKLSDEEIEDVLSWADKYGFNNSGSEGSTIKFRNRNLISDSVKVKDGYSYQGDLSFIGLLEEIERVFGGCDTDRNKIQVYVHNKIVNVKFDDASQVATVYTNRGEEEIVDRENFVDTDSFIDAVIDAVNALGVYA